MKQLLVMSTSKWFTNPTIERAMQTIPCNWSNWWPVKSIKKELELVDDL